MTAAKLTPPEPTECWPANLSITSTPLSPRGELVFEGTGAPWSVARRIPGGVQLEWVDVRFEVTKTSVFVDASEPGAMVDLYWNTLVATVLELRGTTCLHGFMVEEPSGEGIAVLGLSGAGKTSTGRALLERGCTLVCDDLLLLDPGASPVARPFYRRIPDHGERASVDIGGKVREAQPLAARIPSLDRVLSLDGRVSSPGIFRADALEGIDHLLRNPYLPFEITPGTAARRLALAAKLVSTASIHYARPRSQSPSEFAGFLVTGDLP